MTVLEVRDLRVRYGRTEAVRGVDLSLGAGEVVALVGESGSGKSTLAHALVGLLPPGARLRGGIAVDGERVERLPERRWRRLRGRRVGFVPQDPGTGLNPLLTVRAQVEEALRLTGSTADPAGELADVGIPDPERVLAAYPHQLSGGYRQRVLIGMALAGRPGLLVADEPTSALDATAQKAVLDLLRSVAEGGTGILLVTHDLAVAADRADRVAVMSGGRVVEEGPTRQVLRDPQDPYTRLLLDSVPKPAPPRPTATEPLLEVRDVRKSYGPVTAVDGVSFSLGRARTLGLVGASGSGKSTIARMLVGLTEPTSGSVLVAGAPPTRGRVQFVAQNPFDSLDPLWSVGRIIAEPLRSMERTARKRRVHDLLLDVGLSPEHARRRPTALSGGQRQRVAIARALAPEPDLIVLDEPVSALDAVTRAQVLDLLRRLQDSHGTTYLLISHDLAVVASAADQVVVLHDGRAVEAGPTSRVLEAPTAAFTQELLAAVPGGRFPGL